jgi:hypothetical protein
MQVSGHWRTASLVAVGLLIGTAIGPPLAQAAGTALVRIEGGHTTNLAAVSKSGELSVNPGLATTPTGQVKVAVASPSDSVVFFGLQSCASGGIYTIPAGKALIVTGATFIDNAQNLGNVHALELAAGTPANPCKSGLAEAAASTQLASQNQTFNPGIPVPAGDAIGLITDNDTGGAYVYGYLVPAAAVPLNALRNLRAAGLPAVKPRL